MGADQRPRVRGVVSESIPDVLKQTDRWVVWRAGALKENGKFDKFPVDPASGRAVSALNASNWLTYQDALAAYQRGVGNGVGIALSADHPLLVDGTPYFLTALDFDNCHKRLARLKALWVQLGRPYVEESPSGNGLRMFALSRHAVRGGNAGDGREMYSSGRFMTVTGSNGRGEIRDLSDGLATIERAWFPTRGMLPAKALPVSPPYPANLANVREVLAMLDHVSPDVPYEVWRDICWSIASTGWLCAPEIAHKWSRRAPHRYDASALDKLLSRYDPSRGIGLGTLKHHARSNGYAGIINPPQIIHQPPPKLLVTACELRQLPATPYLVRGILPARGLVAIYGEPGTGKSFLGLDLVHAIASNRSDWFGFNVRQAAVAYVTLEGQAGFARRTAALEAHTGTNCPDNLRFWYSDFCLLEHEQVDRLAAEVKQVLGLGTVVVIDTLNQASPGADENSSADMGKIIASAKRLSAEICGVTILIHHAGKDRSRGLRGHSSLRAALDCIIEVSRSSSGRAWVLTKAKDDESDIARHFELVPYDVGTDDWGGPLTSCAIRPTLHPAIAVAQPPRGKNQIIALATLTPLIRRSGGTIDYAQAIDTVAAALPNPSRAGVRAKEAVDGLIRNNQLSLGGAGLCLA